MKILQTTFAVFCICLSSHICIAATLSAWDYSSISLDGQIRVSGIATFSGPDNYAAGDYTLVSFDTVSINDAPITDWQEQDFGTLPPFTSNPTGDFFWSNTVAIPSDHFMAVSGGNFPNFIALGSSSQIQTRLGFNSLGQYHTEFTPASHPSLSPHEQVSTVPEPSALALLVIGLLGFGGYAGQKRQRGM